MNRISVDSSCLSSVGYENGILEVEFNHGAVYHYLNVPESKYDELVSASSIGQYFNANVKYNYETVRVN